MNFEIYNQLTQTCNQALKKHTPPNNVNAETSTEHKQKLSKGKKIAFCSTAAALAALGIYCATRGRSGGAAVKNTVNHTVNNTVNGTINNTSKNTVNHVDDFINNFLKGADDEVEQVFLNHNFSQYGKNGIPLKYSRNQFIQDIDDTIKALPKQQQDDILKQFNLTKSSYDINGIPTLTGNIDNSPESQKIKTLIENFYKQNETTITDPKAKKAFDTVIKGFPEFNMTIGKLQHGTHIYSVDIHSLQVLQKAMNHPSYKALSDESKEVIKLTALVHDFGKRGKVITTGHAAISKKDVELFIDSYNLPKNIKDRVLNQVENHHWFEQYNKGIIDEQGVVNIFKTPEDLEIAKILAKGDFESVNPTFHLGRMNPSKTLTQAEFDQEFAAKMAKIGAPAPNAVQQTAQKAGRTLQEQIQHLENNYTKTTMYTDMGKMNNVEQIEKFSKPGTKDYWIKIGNELYFVPERSSSELTSFTDDLYGLLINTKRNSVNLGHISDTKRIQHWEKPIFGFKYVPSIGKISNTPNSIYDGFAIDCLLETPINSSNFIVGNAGVIRKNHGLSPYEWVYGTYTPKKQFMPNVELSQYLAADSGLLNGMKREDLIKSLDKLDNIKDNDLIITNKVETSCNNYEYLKDTLIDRKNFLQELNKKMKAEPQKQGETLCDYVARIEKTMPAPKTYECPMNNHLLMTLPKEDKEILEQNYQLYQAMKKQKIIHNATDVMEQGSYIHNTSVANVDEILENGLFSGQINIGNKIAGSTVSGNSTSTPAMLDTFIVQKNESIKDYFVLKNRSDYEQNWLPRDGGYEKVITFVIDGKNVTNKLKNTMQPRGNAQYNPTHIAIPMGVAPQIIEKIVVHPALPAAKVNHIKSEIAKRGLDIKVFNTNGVLL